jgi:hypothetical protein
MASADPFPVWPKWDIATRGSAVAGTLPAANRKTIRQPIVLFMLCTIVPTDLVAAA